MGTQSAMGVQEGGSSFFPPPCVPGFAFSLPRMNASLIDSLALVLAPRAVIKSWGMGISPSYYEHGPLLLSLENRRKIEPKEVLSCLIPRLLVVFYHATDSPVRHQSTSASIVGLIVIRLCLSTVASLTGEMIDKLTLTYNRTRQAVITKELIEIISGAAALD